MTIIQMGTNIPLTFIIRKVLVFICAHSGQNQSQNIFFEVKSICKQQFYYCLIYNLLHQSLIAPLIHIACLLTHIDTGSNYRSITNAQRKTKFN